MVFQCIQRVIVAVHSDDLLPYDSLLTSLAEDKPLVLVNTDDYWGSLLQQFQKMHAEGLAYRSPRVRLTVVQSADEAVREIEENLFADVQ